MTRIHVIPIEQNRQSDYDRTHSPSGDISTCPEYTYHLAAPSTIQLSAAGAMGSHHPIPTCLAQSGY